jgi:Papain family cysteine protease
MAPQVRRKGRVFDVRADSLDFRDRMYQPSLVEVPIRRELDKYKDVKVPVLDQGEEGACTGFALATVAHYLLRKREVVPDKTEVSPWMLYETAKRHDEWAGQGYEGSSARGAMKGWYKYGICSAKLWPGQGGRITDDRLKDAVTRPLGAYYRVNHQDLVALHSAIADVGILYATAQVHEGWIEPEGDGLIKPSPEMIGGHAVAIVSYDERGFWIQNSWGTDWGSDGFGLVTYDDWLKNATDVWVARLGAPVALRSATSVSRAHSAQAGQQDALTFSSLRPHIVSVGNDGKLRPNRTFGTTEEDVETIFQQDIPRITEKWAKRRILLYAHGGLVPESTAIQRLADYRAALLAAEVYPISFIWKTDFWTTLTNILDDALRRRRPEGFLDAAKDFMLERLDQAIEVVARATLGKAQWEEMKEIGIAATTGRDGGARKVAKLLGELVSDDPQTELHVVGHSAGAVFHAPLVQLLTSEGRIQEEPMKGKEGMGLPISSCTLWTPACTLDLFKRTYLPAINAGRIGRFAVYALSDEAERGDHCANIYHKSLLYLVSNAFEDQPRIIQRGEPLLGMERFLTRRFDTVDDETAAVFANGKADLVLAPNTAPPASRDASAARHHGDFDDDGATVGSTLARILDGKAPAIDFAFPRSASALRDQRLNLGR